MLICYLSSESKHPFIVWAWNRPGRREDTNTIDLAETAEEELGIPRHRLKSANLFCVFFFLLSLPSERQKVNRFTDVLGCLLPFFSPCAHDARNTAGYPRGLDAQWTDGQVFSAFPHIRDAPLVSRPPQPHLQVVKYKVLSVHFPPNRKIVSLNLRCSAICTKCLWRFMNATDHGGRAGRRCDGSLRRRETEGFTHTHTHTGFGERRGKNSHILKSIFSYTHRHTHTHTQTHTHGLL